MGRHVPKDDGAGPHERAAPDPHRRHERGLRSDRGPVVDEGPIPVGSAGEGRAGAAHVGELGSRADENVLAQDDAVPDARVALDPRARADDGARGDEAKRADDDVVLELGALGHHRRGMDPGRRTRAQTARHRPRVTGLRARARRPRPLALARGGRTDYGAASMARGPQRSRSEGAPESPLTYKNAGVDIDAGDEFVERIKPLARATRIAEVVSDVGGFAGLCRVPADIEEPVLVSGTDGVGTKLKVAFATGVHDTIGFDLVGMCVNDVITCGARPLFFLDYFATGHLDVGVAEKVVAGIAAACKESGCALLGGETAELPGMYAPGEYDLAGFSVGVVARKKLVDGTRVAAGDVALGLPSSGLHSNGYSLARQALLETMGLAYDDRVPELGGRSVGEALLAPTRLYARAVQALVLGAIDVRAMSHVTGGGLPGNLPRVLPEGLGVRVEGVWARGGVFDLIQRAGAVAESEMRRTFNLGVGFVVIVPAVDVTRAMDTLRGAGEAPFVLGSVVSQAVDRPFEERVEWALGGVAG